MIYGVGVDIIEIDRVERAVNRTSSFLAKVFTENEIHYFKNKNNNYESLAGSYAAKEAFSKAVGLGFRGFTLGEVEVVRDELGKPSIVLYGNAKELADKLNVSNIHLSISHNKTDAIAYVILEI
ncbi:holo-ACP synthase [Clostridium paridis]|uniref:Holo-[acyl-carrier-protein] synthase n=1 Tax=Clostridium paridis TaxID=2803863 RepID=A0A937K460_9CLOT|nr:holo-ACP synthase [Clostridium paridis]MBL4931529.1 holo-ACP synthase [Clostridium paridis]